MNFTRRRGAIALFIALGVLLLGVAVTLNIGWIILNQRRAALLVLGIIFFAVLIAGVVLNTVFLLREIRRNERQDSFLNAVTHELKTPIASIRLYLETLQRRPIEEAQRQQFYTIMLADSDRLLATVEQVLKAGQLGQKQRQLNRTLVPLDSLLSECIAITAQRHHLPPGAIQMERIPPDATPRVIGLAEDLSTAVLNVLDNAVKYSTGTVQIRCSLSVERSLVIIRISDSGVGLPPGHQKRIFKRFYRVPGRTMVRIKGTGLGLFLVRAILRQHGGDATAHSPGIAQGTTITLTLPLAQPTPSSA
ncbi:MAG: HAMP domain-containing sensor histidine kinase [Acidobacteriaceae bacterium]